jgi:hypothetical protein
MAYFRWQPKIVLSLLFALREALAEWLAIAEKQLST